MMAAALGTYAAGIKQVVVVGEAGQAGEAGWAGREMRERYRPFCITLNLDQTTQSALAAKLPFVAAMKPVGGQAAAYVCRDFTCRAPVTDRAALEKELA